MLLNSVLFQTISLQSIGVPAFIPSHGTFSVTVLGDAMLSNIALSDALNDITAQFHFLRPIWLLAVIPLLLLAWWTLHRLRKPLEQSEQQRAQWAPYIDPHLMPYVTFQQEDIEQQPFQKELVDNKHQAHGKTKPSKSKNSGLVNGLKHFAVYGALTAMVLAIAGPTWQQKPMPAVAGEVPTMIVLSLAQSMNATDVKPTRLQRAIHKINDILEQTRGEQTGLVIYSDMAFTASPLTNDSKVIQSMLPELSTNLMPVLGNRLDDAINEATALLQRGGAYRGNIVILTDGVGDAEAQSFQSARQANQLGYTVSVLGIGTKAGADLTMAGGQTINDAQGQAMQTQLDTNALAKLADAGGGVFTTITASNQDVQQVLTQRTANQGGLFGNEASSTGDTLNNQDDTSVQDWVDNGFWLLFIPLLLMPFAFKRGTFDNFDHTFGNASRNTNNRAGLNKRTRKRTSTVNTILSAIMIATVSLGALYTPKNAQASTNHIETNQAGLTQGESNPVFQQKNLTYRAPNLLVVMPVMPASIIATLGDMWQKLWKTTSQQAQQAFDSGHYQRAIALFARAKNTAQHISWQASSAYRAGEYAQSATLFAQQQQFYNLGNALAKSGELQGAIDAYNKHLEQYPEDEDAIFNRDLVQKLLDKQEQDGQGEDNQEQEDSQSGSQGDDGEQGGEPNEEDGQSEQNTQDESQSSQQSDQQSAQDSKNGQAQSSELEEDNEAEGQVSAQSNAQGRPLDQATEQALRRVPDDASGLLRARIMQHYRQQQYRQQ